MAKSLRSKWRRKCRAVKRERYGEKELERLKKTLAVNENTSKGTTDVEMTDISEICTVVDAKKVKKDVKAKRAKDAQPDTAGASEPMELDVERVYNKKTMRDQFGNYPVWMNNRKIMKHKKGRAKSQKSTTKTNKRLTRRQKKTVKQKK